VEGTPISISGKKIALKVGAATPSLVPGLQSWTAEESVQELDATTAADGGFEHPDLGLQGVRVSMTLVIDINQGDLLVLRAGSIITHLKLFADINANNPIFDIPTFLVFKSTPKGEINGRFSYEVVGRAAGAYTINEPN
jgi:hypothetical protein